MKREAGAEAKKGLLYGALAYLMWGFLSLYWKQLQGMPSDEILAGRVVLAFATTLLAAALLGQWSALWADLRALWDTPRQFWKMVAAAYLVTANWFLFIWAVNSGQMVETSLGYYINPLISVVLGMLFLRERLARAEKIAVALAAAGVLLLTIEYGRFPWAAILLALSFGLYGLLKKTVPLDALRGLVIETLFVAPAALAYLIYLASTGRMTAFHGDAKIDALFLMSGAATAIPLVLFAKGAQAVPLYAIGFLQYICPTILLLLGVLYYGEAFNGRDLVAFSIIWSGVALFLLSKYAEARCKKASASTPV